jgi:hypothetical protein
MEPLRHRKTLNYTIYAFLGIRVVFEAATTSLVFALRLAECADYVQNGWECAQECHEFLEAGLGDDKMID